MSRDWSEGEVEASPPRLCLRRDREVTLPCLGQQQAAPSPPGCLSPSQGAEQPGYPTPRPGTPPQKKKRSSGIPAEPQP